MIYCIARCIACFSTRSWAHRLMLMHGILQPILPPSAWLPKFLVRVKNHAGPLSSARFCGSRTSWAVTQQQRRSIIAWLAGNGRTWFPCGSFCSRPTNTVAGMCHPLMTRVFLRAKRKRIARTMLLRAGKKLAKGPKRAKEINGIPIRRPSGMNRRSATMSWVKTKPLIHRRILQRAKSSSQAIIQGTMIRRLCQGPNPTMRQGPNPTMRLHLPWPKTIPLRVKLNQTTLLNRVFLAITHFPKTFRPRAIRLFPV